MAQRDAGLTWLNVHPLNLCGDDDWTIVRLARGWRDGFLPGPGGIGDQAAFTVAAIEVVLTAWQKMEAARWERERPKR